MLKKIVLVQNYHQRKTKIINHLINYDDEEKFTCDNAEINVESIGVRGARVLFQEDGEV